MGGGKTPGTGEVSYKEQFHLKRNPPPPHERNRSTPHKTSGQSPDPNPLPIGGQRVRDRREYLKLSVVGLANLARVQSEIVIYIERGLQVPRADLERVLEAMGMEVGDVQ